MTSALDTKPEPRVDFVIPASGSLAAFGKPTMTLEKRKNSSGVEQSVHSYSGVPVFRSGRFASSSGVEKEWVDEQISQMVANFDKLRNDGNFAKVPVRKGHASMFDGNRMDGLIGYITGLRVEKLQSPLKSDDNTYSYLLADYEILDADAQEKISNGLWVNRSAEIGMYPTNSPVTEYWPVFMGVAYVDIPAVEGLEGFSLDAYSKEFGTQQQFSIQVEVPTMPDAPKPNLPGTLAEFSIGGVTTTDYARVQSYVSDLESKNSGFAAQVTSLEGQVKSLTEFQTATVAASRNDYLTSLAQSIDGHPAKLHANQLDAEKAFAGTLSDDQWSAYKARWEAAPSSTLLDNHGQQSMNEDHRTASKATSDPKATAISVLRSLRDFSKMSDEKIMQTEAWATLRSIDPHAILKTL